MGLTNDGPMVAFNSRDAGQMGNLYLGDISTGSVPVAYVAAANHEIFWVRIDGGRLFWLEYAHQGPNGAGPVIEWWVRERLLATGRDTVLAHDRSPEAGGKAFAFLVRVLGDRMAMALRLPDDSVRLQVRSIAAGAIIADLPVAQRVYDVALAGDDVVLSTLGTEVPEHDTIRDLHLDRWTAATGTQQIAAAAFGLKADRTLAAWISDPVASKGGTGHPDAPRLDVAAAPFDAGLPISPVVDGHPTMGVFDFAVADGWTAWWEVENDSAAGRTVLTAWRSGWAEPAQFATDSDTPWISLGGGWLAWYQEGGSDHRDGVFGIPLTALAP